MKSNKSFLKRLRVTKTGKILARKAGGNHFNAKEKRESALDRRRPTKFELSPKTKGRFLPREN